MADIEPNNSPPGFNVVEPGFRVFDDGSVATYGADLGRPFFSNLEEAAAWVNAAVNGAYSVLPGVHNAGRAVARGTGLIGGDEFRRFARKPMPSGRDWASSLSALNWLFVRYRKHGRYSATTLGCGLISAAARRGAS
jgi:hypothetical protein